MYYDTQEDNYNCCNSIKYKHMKQEIRKCGSELRYLLISYSLFDIS